ncbi:uncharacterized protein UV8b_03407 [Ustilaginoidea virens]|uniref:Uncharacterized protein n=1 Tax=Ustilaginoidea virens TaxID=1159556 RepID=A0A8E5HPF1_USTVR|nr:uncharacterized protein UV8b_03407 [Ustilaginoidea virens]QUC19166.1 hypothetical protein UV8b_03407 [Ustilaginoidea virens]
MDGSAHDTRGKARARLHKAPRTVDPLAPAKPNGSLATGTDKSRATTHCKNCSTMRRQAKSTFLRGDPMLGKPSVKARFWLAEKELKARTTVHCTTVRRNLVTYFCVRAEAQKGGLRKCGILPPQRHAATFGLFGTSGAHRPRGRFSLGNAKTPIRLVLEGVEGVDGSAPGCDQQVSVECGSHPQAPTLPMMPPMMPPMMLLAAAAAAAAGGQFRFLLGFPLATALDPTRCHENEADV